MSKYRWHIAITLSVYQIIMAIDYWNDNRILSLILLTSVGFLLWSAISAAYHYVEAKNAHFEAMNECNVTLAKIKKERGFDNSPEKILELNRIEGNLRKLQKSLIQDKEYFGW